MSLDGGHVLNQVLSHKELSQHVLSKSGVTMPFTIVRYLHAVLIKRLDGDAQHPRHINYLEVYHRVLVR